MGALYGYGAHRATRSRGGVISGIGSGVAAATVGSFKVHDGVVFIARSRSGIRDRAAVKSLVGAHHTGGRGANKSFHSLTAGIFDLNGSGTETGHGAGAGDAEVHGDLTIAAGAFCPNSSNVCA